jgi:hypothetical protein
VSPPREAFSRAINMDVYRNGLGVKSTKKERRQKGKRRRSSAVLASTDDVEMSDISPNTSTLDASSSKLKLKFVVQSTKGGSQVSPTVGNAIDEKSPKKATPPTNLSTPTKLSSPTSQFTSPDKLRMKISMGNRPVSVNDDMPSETQRVFTPNASENVEAPVDANNVSNFGDVSMNVDNDSVAKKKTARVPEFIQDKSSR